MFSYYVVTRYTAKGWFDEDTTSGSVLELNEPLTTRKGLVELMNWLRSRHKDEVVLWWTELDSEENNGSKTEDTTVR